MIAVKNTSVRPFKKMKKIDIERTDNVFVSTITPVQDFN
jgi:hypothetical protein